MGCVKIELLRERFNELFSRSAEFVVRSPGRVNLIGEHIDYNGYGVLPMAIEQSIYVLVAPNENNVIRFRNSEAQFNSFDWTMNVDWPGTSGPRWHDYFLSGWKGALDWLNNKKKDHNITGLDVLVHGEIPPAAGLSSSSALVCAAVLCTWTAATGKMFEGYSRSDLVDVATKSERLVGLEGGGMDQAAVVLAEAGTALHIDFDPLEVRKVQLPPEAVFCVLHCGVSANKAAASHYNERVVECRIAAQLLTLDRRPNWKEWRKIRRLRDFQELTSLDLVQCEDKAKALFEDRSYERSELLKMLGVTDEDFRKNCLNPATVSKDGFELLKRTIHVFQEANRVDEFEQACKEENLNALGDLMNQSHNSCRDFYQCSCPEMDTLIEKCLSAGAIGARLTGAGWGGCAVALMSKNKVEEVRQQLDVLFLSQPSAGIEVWRV